MGELLPAVGNLAPPVAVAVLLAVLLVRLWRQASADRDAYQQAIAELRAEAAAQLRHQAERHDGQIGDLREQVTLLRRELAEVRADLERERRARHQAEDEAAAYRRQLGLADGGRM